jgi:hypothetical protein
MRRGNGRGPQIVVAFPQHTPADLQSDVVVERAGVRLLVGNTQLRQRFQNHVGLDFELASQLIDANFTHTMTFRRSENKRAVFTNFQPLLFPVPRSGPALP